MPISITMTTPSQYALKLPATNPERMPSDAPPSRAEVTTSRTWRESVDVKTLTNSGMIAPASVPQLMTDESFHHNEPSPRSRMSTYDARYVTATETSDVSQTSEVSGASKFIVRAPVYRRRAIASLSRYEAPLVMIMSTRIRKIQMR